MDAVERAGVPTLCDVEMVSDDTLALIAACDTVILPRAVAAEIAGTDELKELLEEAVKNEDYEKASLIRDEIKRRKRE